MTDTRKIPSRDAVAVVLAGGESTRMGVDKAGIRVRGVTLLERVESELSEYFDRVVVSIRPGTEDRYGAESGRRLFVEDIVSDRGPIGGIYSVMRSVETELYFVAACDMPFLSGRIAVEMIAAAAGSDVVVPRMTNGRLHPLHAVYRRACLRHIAAQIEGASNKIIDFYGNVRVLYYEENILRQSDPELHCLENINTRENLRTLIGG